MVELNKIYNENCLGSKEECTGMWRIPDKSINLILADLPYGTTECKWDSIIPLQPLWEQYERIIKDNGAIVLTSSQPFTTELISSKKDFFKYCWVWEKTVGSGFINCKNAPIKIHEDICVFSKGTTANKSKRRMEYNPQGLIYSPYRKKRNKPMSAKEGGYIKARPNHVSEYDVTYTNYPKSIIKFPNPNNKTIHPTQKPVQLFEYIVNTYTNEGDLVLDNCIGSGTTAIACINTNRNYIGFELDKEYHRLANERIHNHMINLENSNGDSK